LTRESDSYEPNKDIRWIRDRLSVLENHKADKDVIKSENRRIMDKIEQMETTKVERDMLVTSESKLLEKLEETHDEVDDLRAQVLTIHKGCTVASDIAEMKAMIAETKQKAEIAYTTANIVSERGFKIIIGFIGSLLTLGIAAVVWALGVSHTADDAMTRVQAMEKKDSAAAQYNVDKMVDIIVDKAIDAAFKKQMDVQDSEPNL
jgi:hypothetical protein